MGLLSEPQLDELVAAGCSCGARSLLFRSFCDGRLPLLGGEPVGALEWVYDGEKFVDGVFEVTCGECKRVIFGADCCPRCHGEGALPIALRTPNAWPVPLACPSCDGEETRYVALVPARVTYEGKRVDRSVRTSIEMHDEGFHGLRVECVDCGVVAERTDSCPLCAAPAPLRPRP